MRNDHADRGGVNGSSEGPNSIFNLWGAPRIHGELLKLGINVGQTTVAKYMSKRRCPPSQGWKTFLDNHADGIASMDLFVVPTISFRLLYAFLILQHARRELLWLGVTAHPTAEWIAQQLTEAFAWRDAPRYVVRDRDRIYGARFIQRVRFMGIRDRPISARSPWQNGGSSARFDVNASTTSSSSANAISVICCNPTEIITIRGELTCPCARTRRSLAQPRPAAVSLASRFWADCITNIVEFEFAVGTAIKMKLIGCVRKSVSDLV
jgi:hypothetical protein